MEFRFRGWWRLGEIVDIAFLQSSIYSAVKNVIQSRPIKMRAPILYLANRWMDSKMLLKPNRFLSLVIFLFVAFH